ncbi:MAG: glucose-6-phosphate isomerase [Anaerolineae bacterium]|nr:glucose-6-phosphate isomerase [Anaerolineae bacterium]
MEQYLETPFTFGVNIAEAALEKYDNHITRRLSAMRGQYLDQAAFEAMLSQEDQLLYEVFEIRRPEKAGELLNGLSVLHPGKVGQEYFMTKGHFHAVLETGEVYYCLKGEGYIVMETPEGDWAAEAVRPGRVLYVPPRWAHRSVNTSPTEDLVTFFIYPGHAGHDYGTIEQKGFRKLVIEEAGQPKIIDNPRWQASE